jgi:hypothetical protein
VADGGLVVEPLKLNLGAGQTELPGFVPVDRTDGREVYPLDYPDGSVDTIRASHVLEHFSHTEVVEVVRHWVSKLAPGGLLRIAVPDLEYIAREYLAGKAINVQGYLLGGQVDENDYHKCAFDAEVLEEILIAAGLERLHRWDSELQDCAALPVSLNIGGYKPSGDQTVCEGVTAILSAPRFGPVAHFRCALAAFGKAGVPYQIAGGAYWHQVISDLLEAQSESTRYVITCDYDTVFSYADVLELYRLMEAEPRADAICTLQSKRGSDHALFGLRDDDGGHITSLPDYQLNRHLLPVTTGHFGLTIFRSESLRNHPHPWMDSQPNDDGRWRDGKVDADIQFWVKWKACGRRLYLAPRVVVGHLQEMVTWPGRDLKPIYQTLTDYDKTGKPTEVNR